MSPRFDEVARLKELEKKATPTPWYYGVHPDNCDTCEDRDPDDTGMCDNPIKPDFGPVAMISSGDVVPGIFASVVFDTEDNPNGQTITCFRNAAPWLLEAAACFQPGDADLLDELIEYIDFLIPSGMEAVEVGDEEFEMLLDDQKLLIRAKDHLFRMLAAAKIMEEKESTTHD